MKNDDDNVIELGKPKPKDDTEVELTFEEIMKKNEANKKRLAAERVKANKSVTRSYRLKK